MIHPLATLLFDLFLIGAAASILSAMAFEYLASRSPAVGRRGFASRSSVALASRRRAGTTARNRSASRPRIRPHARGLQL